jgi:hypothetical protein
MDGGRLHCASNVGLAAVCLVALGRKTVDHPSDGELIAYARRYFKVEDRMLPQKD